MICSFKTAFCSSGSCNKEHYSHFDFGKCFHTNLSKELLELAAEEPPKHDGGEGAALGGNLGGIADSAQEDRHLLLNRESLV